MDKANLIIFIEGLIKSGIYQVLVFENNFWWLIGIIAGISIVLAWVLRGTVMGYLSILLLLITLLVQPVMVVFSETVSNQVLRDVYKIPLWHLIAYFIISTLTSVVVFLNIRYFLGSLDGFKDILVKKSTLVRDGRTDIRNIDHYLPSSKRVYCPSKYFNSKKGVFQGLNGSSQPVYLTKEKFQSSHIDLIGTTGSGKGVEAGVLLTQAIQLGESVVVIDPKSDEYLPHVLGQSAKQEDVNFIYLDLHGETAQWNPFYNKSAYEIEELLAAGFGLSERGTDADFYRLNDRKAARLFARSIENSSLSLHTAFSQFISNHGERIKDAPKFIEDLEEIASLPVTHIGGGIDIAAHIQKGGAIYVQGSMRNPRVQKLQKMLVLSVMQVCENRDRETARHVCMFLDEFKYLISRPALEALGAIRDKRAHVILAHQSIGDLRDCPKDIDPDSVLSSINENCSIKFTYRVNDPDTADWLARMSGNILVDDETRTITTNRSLTEIKNPERMLRQTERCLVDTNMLHSLPPRCAVQYGNGLANFIFTSPIKVTKNPDYTTPTPFDDSDNGYPYSHVTGKKHSSVMEDLLDVD